jgi:hypothetical protein
MATRKSGMRVGITHSSLDQEQASQKRLPPRGTAKQGSGMKSSPKREKNIGTASAPDRLNEHEESSITPKGAKGGKTGGSRAGLTSVAKKKTRRR